MRLCVYVCVFDVCCFATCTRITACGYKFAQVLDFASSHRLQRCLHHRCVNVTVRCVGMCMSMQSCVNLYSCASSALQAYTRLQLMMCSWSCICACVTVRCTYTCVNAWLYGFVYISVQLCASARVCVYTCVCVCVSQEETRKRQENAMNSQVMGQNPCGARRRGVRGGVQDSKQSKLQNNREHSVLPGWCRFYRARQRPRRGPAQPRDP